MKQAERIDTALENSHTRIGAETPEPAPQPQPSVTEFDRRGIKLPARALVGGIITPQ